MRRICKDEEAKASFAIAGVLILLLGSVSAIHLAAVNSDFRRSQIENKEIGKMNTAVDKAHIEVQTEAYYKALNAIWVTTQIHNGFTPNPMFQESFSKYIDDNFPRKVGEFEVTINDNHAHITNKQKTTEDFVRENNLISEKYKGKSIKELDLALTDGYDQTTRTPYYSVLGYMNYTVQEKDSDRKLNKNLTFNRTIKCPYPFLEETFQSFAGNAQGDSTDLGRMIKYILTTAAQYRVLMGLSKKYDNDGNKIGDAEGTDWTSLINEDDVELAVNIALLLEEIRRFRTVDPESLSTFDSNNADGHPVERTITRLIENYATFGTIDAADIFALYTSLDSNPLDINSTMAQSMYAIVDQYSKELLYHFGLDENAKDLRKFVTNILEWLGLDPNLKVDGGTYHNSGKWARAYNYDYEYRQIPIGWDMNGNWHWDLSGGYYGNQNDEGKYDNNSYEALNTIINIISDFEHLDEIGSYPIDSLTEKTYFYNYYRTRIYFTHKLELNDSKDTAKLQIKGPDDSNWINLASFTNSTHSPNWAFKYYDISDYNDTEDVQIRFLFESNETEVESGWKIKNFCIWKIYYDGREVKDVFVGEGNVDVDLTKNIPYAILSEIGKTLEWFRDKIEGYLPELFKDLTKFTKEKVSSLLFGDAINPKDEYSIFESLRKNVGQRVGNDVIDLKKDIKNYEDFTIKFAKELLNISIVEDEHILDLVIETINNWLEDDNIKSWIDIEINQTVDILKNMAEKDDTFLKYYADYFYDQDLTYYNNLRNLIYDMVKDDPFWNDDFKTNIEDTLNSFIELIDGVKADITDFIENDDTSGVESFLDAIRDLESLFWDVTEQFIDMFLEDIIEGSKVANTEFQLGSNYLQLFEFWDGNLIGPNDPKSIDYESVIIFQKPHYLNAEKKDMRSDVNLDNIDINDGDPNNDLLVYIGEPKGIHYTKSLKTTDRPFETQWNLSIVGRIELSTRTDEKIFLGHGTHYYTWYNGTLDIDLPITITVYSGWELKGIDYDPKNIFTEDFEKTIDFLDSIWKAGIPMAKWGVDYHQKFIEISLEEGPLMDKKLQWSFDIVRSALRSAQNPYDLNFVNTIINAGNKLGIRDVGLFPAYGFTFLISVKSDDISISLSQENGSFSFSIIIDKRTKDIEIHGDISFWSLNVGILISA